MLLTTRFKHWFKRKNLKAHFTAVSLATVAGIIKMDPDVHQLLFKFLKDHQEAGSMIVLIAGIIFRYSNSDKPALEKKIEADPAK